jgi:hypothetical protein
MQERAYVKKKLIRELARLKHQLVEEWAAFKQPDHRGQGD